MYTHSCYNPTPHLPEVCTHNTSKSFTLKLIHIIGYLTSKLGKEVLLFTELCMYSERNVYVEFELKQYFIWVHLNQ